MARELFRKVALERLSSPEQMDQLMRVASPRGWLTLLALMLVVATAVTWGFRGRVPTKVYGQGILIRPGGVHAVQAPTPGYIMRLSVQVDDVVARGGVVACIFRSDERAASQLSYVFSQYSGRVLDVLVAEGSRVEAGMPVVNLESSEVQLEAVLYVPLSEGKKLRAGMPVHISPSTVKREEHGYMLGKVREVAEFPATQQGMMRLLENGKLVERLSGEGAPIQVFAELICDPQTPSRYKWSSSHGPDTEIHRGTPCTASITVEEQRPVSLVIPAFKELLGM
jgi:hypothetical protein